MHGTMTIKKYIEQRN